MCVCVCVCAGVCVSVVSVPPADGSIGHHWHGKVEYSHCMTRAITMLCGPVKEQVLLIRCS